MRSLMKLFGFFHEEEGDAILEARLCALGRQNRHKGKRHLPVSPFRAGRLAV